MGEIVEVAKFCKKEKSADPYHARAFVDEKKSKVVCQSAARVAMSYLCQGQTDQYCQDKDIGCYKLKDKFASALRVEAALIAPASGGGKKLNCHFAAGKKSDAYKLNL